MTGTTIAGSYRTLLRTSHVATTIGLSSVGRLGYATLPLLLLFTLKDATGSFATASTAMSLYALAGLTMPARSRWIDHRGQRATLPWLTLAMTIPLVTIIALAATHTRLPGPAWLVLAGTAGLAAPPLGPSTRAQWRAIAPDSTTTAYALDGTLEEALWLAGPAIAGVLLAAPGAMWGLAGVPVLLGIGALGLAMSPWATARDTQDATTTTTSPLKSRRLWPILGTMLLTGTGFALANTGIAAVADAAGRRILAGLAEVTLGMGSVLGGLVWGRRHPAWRAGTHVAVLLGLWAGVIGILALGGVQIRLLPALALAGAAAAPLWVLAYTAADDAVDAAARTEASTWVTTSANLGSAAGTALAGILSTGATTNRPLQYAAVLAVLTGLLTWRTWSSQPTA